MPAPRTTSPGSDLAPSVKPTADVYLALLVISLIAQVAAVLFLWMDRAQYDKAPPPVAKLAPIGSSAPAAQPAAPSGGALGGGGAIGGAPQAAPPAGGAPAGAAPGGAQPTPPGAAPGGAQPAPQAPPAQPKN